MMRALKSYLGMRRALGLRLVRLEMDLCGFTRFATARGERHVRSLTAVEWARQGATDGVRHTRLRAAAAFARYARAEDPRHELPPCDVFPCQPQRKIPYIYSDRDVVLLLQETSRLGPPGSLRPLTFTTLFGLLAVTGFRISEALNLCLEDFLEDGLLLRECKFHKSRLVPLHPTTRAALERYLASRTKFPTEDRHLFISLHGGRIPYSTVYGLFRKLLARLGLRKNNGARSPRIHDLRHTFCVKALLRAPAGVEKVDQHILAVATYVGHKDGTSTYWYQHATPELMTDIAKSCERHFRKGAS